MLVGGVRRHTGRHFLLMFRHSAAHSQDLTTMRTTTQRLLLLAGAAVASSTAAFATSSTSAAKKSFTVTTWNIAAINNNPFEYWIEHKDPRYNSLMQGVERFMNDPSEDVEIGKIFSQAKYDELEALMAKQASVNPEVLKEVREKRWPELKSRKIVSGFLKDAEIGKKRLASMPDRLTNTIALKTETAGSNALFRPTPINCCSTYFKSFDDWWSHWKHFMFETKLPNQKNVFSLLKTIPRSKYPELTEDDERVSLPLQVVAIAVFDSILVHMLEKIGKGSWQELRGEMCAALNSKKNDRVLEILHKTYAESDIICLQEVGSAFAGLAEKTLSDFWTLVPTSSKAISRDQNSVILLRKSTFPETLKDVSASVPLSGAPVEDGDLLVVQGHSKEGIKFVLASFHGDTDGLATIPVVRAVASYATSQNAVLVFGLDANAYNKAKKGKQLDVRDFNKEFRNLKLTSCFGNDIDPNNFSTFNARTFLQPQLNKAASRSEFMEKGDVNPKDFILTFESHGSFSSTLKDNTGEKKYIEGMVFPTLTFPSDHGVVSTVLSLEGVPNLKSEL